MSEYLDIAEDLMLDFGDEPFTFVAWMPVLSNIVDWWIWENYD